MATKLVQYKSPILEHPYVVELHLTEAEAKLFRHLLACWVEPGRYDCRSEIESFARTVRRLAADADFPI